jgi:hypothetical protein
MTETMPPVGSDAPTTPPAEKWKSPPITMVMLDDDDFFLSSIVRILELMRITDVVASFHETEGNSQVNALVAKVREALANGHHVVVLSDGNMPNGTTPVTVSAALAKEGFLATRGDLEKWIKSREKKNKVSVARRGVPILVVSGGDGSNRELAAAVEAAINKGDIIGILGKPFEIDALRQLVLGLATSDRAELQRTIEGIARTFEQAFK